MKRHAAYALAALLWCLFPAAAPAADAPALSPQTYQALQVAQEQLEAGDTAKAIAALQKLSAATAEQPYEQAVVLQTLAHAYIAKEDYAAAIPHLQRSLELAALPAEAAQRTRYNLAQLYMATERFAEAVELLKAWFAAAEQPQAEAHVMLGSALLQLKRYQEAIAPLRTAIDMSAEPKESWYQGLLGAHSELKQYDQCAALLHTMLQRFPERGGYWRQLAGMHLLREKYAEAAAVMELAHLRGHLETERDLLNLAQLQLHQNAPYKAAALIEQEIGRGRIEVSAKNWELAANAWAQAREMKRAITALERAAGQDAELGLRLAQLYLEDEQWQKAAGHLRQLLKQPRLKDDTAGQLWLLLGMAQQKLGRTDDATVAFTEAARFNRTRDAAGQWLAYLRSL